MLCALRFLPTVFLGMSETSLMLANVRTHYAYITCNGIYCSVSRSVTCRTGSLRDVSHGIVITKEIL